MFSSTNAFGQSSTSPFGSQSGFGQTNNNPFAPKPSFGSTNPFGSQSGGSFFGNSSTGVFGAPQSSPLGSTPVFGASSSSSPAFGSTTPAFGSTSSAFGGTSAFGQKPAFGGFGSSSAQTSPFGSSFQQSQPAFGTGLFGSSQPAFGTPSTPTFGQSSSTPAFGAPSSTPAFGTSTTPAFGSTPSPAFGSTASPFGVSNSPFGSSTPAFGATSTPSFGATSPAFGNSTTPFGVQSAPSFSFGSTPAFGQSTSAFGSTPSPFGTTPSPFGTTQTSSFGAQTSTPAFGNTGFVQTAVGGGQRGGTRVAAYQATPETDSGSGTQPSGKLESISAMPVYREKSHEELRWEDYQSGDKGGPAPAGQSTSGINFGSSPFASSTTTPFGQSSANPFSSTTSSNLFTPKPPAFNATPNTSNPFGTSTTPSFNSSAFATSNPSNPFGSASSTTPLFGPTPGFGTNTSPNPFGQSSSASGFGTTTSLFGSSSAQSTTPTFGPSLSFGNTQSSPLFQSTTPPFGQSSSAFGQTASSFAQSTPAFSQSNLFNAPSTGFGGNLFSSAPLLNTSNPGIFGQMPSLSSTFQPSQPAQNNPFGFSNFGQTQGANASGLGGQPTLFSQPLANQSSVVAQPSVVANPFGTLPAMPQMSIGRTGTSSSIQYGISSLPVVDKPAPVSISSLLTSRHLSQRRLRLPARKYHPKTEGSKVPFFSDDEETQSTPKADALFVPRENPRALVIRPLDQWPSRGVQENVSPLKHVPSPPHENGKGVCPPVNGASAKDKDKDFVENGLDKEAVNTVKQNQKSNGVHEGNHIQKGGSSITLTGHRAGEAAIVYEHGADIEALMPKLRHSDYYTEPRIQELAAKERAEPGFCRRVKDFVVGRHGYGSIKFMGETDVRRLDLESLVQFNNREVIVYMDESKKPPVGQGLNKPAEVTLLNVKCSDKKTGQQITEGPRIEKYKEMLQRKAGDQGADFVSYDPVRGEWKFRVQHFSKYMVQEDDEESECGENYTF